MFSNTQRRRRGDRVLGFRKDALSSLAVPCPRLRRFGKCAVYETENTLRREIAKAKEEELRRRALSLYETQLRLIEESNAEGEKDEAAVFPCFSTAPADKPDVLRQLLEELKAEPAYVHWNLDAELEARLVERGIRRCRFSHQPVLQATLRRSQQAKRDNTKHEITTSNDNNDDSNNNNRHHNDNSYAHANENTTNNCTTHEKGGGGEAEAEAAVDTYRRASAAERARVFAGLTPFQRFVVCLAWQRRFRVPRSVLAEESDQDASDEDNARENNNIKPAANQEVGSSGAKPGMRWVVRQVCRPALGVFIFPALPRVIAYTSAWPKAEILRLDTLRFFTNEAPDTTLRRDVFPAKITEKEIDLSRPAQATEFVTALLWVLEVYCQEGQGKSLPPDNHNSNPNNRMSKKNKNNKAYTASEPVVLRSLGLRNCNLVHAEALVGALARHGVPRHLLALDLSHNRLVSMRFLFLLRAEFGERLLRLGLVGNPITQKPTYVEQVRRALPRLTSLDGEPIRRPPLRLPKPRLSEPPLVHLPPEPSREGTRKAKHVNNAFDRKAGQFPKRTRGESAVRTGDLSETEYNEVWDSVERFLYSWESRRVPRTAQETAEGLFNEETLEDVNFPFRYLHPSVVFSLTVAPQFRLFDAERMRLDYEVAELGPLFEGLALSARDLREVGVLDVAVRSTARNLLEGRDAIQRAVRGPLKVFLAYQTSLYPERAVVQHHVHSGRTSVMKLTEPFEEEKGSLKGGRVRSEPPGTSTLAPPTRNETVRTENSCTSVDAAATKGAQNRAVRYLVTLHGRMSWRFPSQRGPRSVIVAVAERTLVLGRNLFPTQNTAWERRRRPGLVICADHVLLRPLRRSDNSLNDIMKNNATKNANITNSNHINHPENTNIITSNTNYHTHSIASPLLPRRYEEQDYAPVGDAVAQGRRLARLVVQFGLETCSDGPALVQAVMERTTSEAAEEAVLTALIFGVPPEPEEEQKEGQNDKTTTSPIASSANNSNFNSNTSLNKVRLEGEDEKMPGYVKAANASARAILAQPRYQTATSTRNGNSLEQEERFSFWVHSLLVDPPNDEDEDDDDKQEGAPTNKDALALAGRRIPLALIHDLAVVMNRHYTLHFR